MSNFYSSRLATLRSEAIAEASDPKWIAGKVFSECCINAVGRSRFEAFATKREALCAASEHIGDYDLSTTEFYRPEDRDIEIGDPAMERVEASLEAGGNVTLGDYRIILEPVTADDIAAALAMEEEE